MSGLALKNTREGKMLNSIQPQNPFFTTPLFQNRFGQALLPRTKQRNIPTYLTRSFGPCSLNNLPTAHDRKLYWRMLRSCWNTRNPV